MSALVEHVGNAIFEAMDITDGLDGTAAENYARAAIRATLEYARDNVSQGMIYAGQEIPDEIFVDEAENVFRAMIDALLAELDGADE